MANLVGTVMWYVRTEGVDECAESSDLAERIVDHLLAGLGPWKRHRTVVRGRGLLVRAAL